jgi:hypothetical protein
MHKYLYYTGIFGLLLGYLCSYNSLCQRYWFMVLQNYQNFIELTSNMIYIVALGVSLKCPREIYLNTQCPQNKTSITWLSSNVSATPIGQMGIKMGWFPLGNGVCLIMKKAPSDSPIWQLKKRELLIPLSSEDFF